MHGKTARPGDHPGTGGGIGTAGCVDGLQNTALAAPTQELQTAERVALAEREAIRSVIVAYQCDPAMILGDLARLYKEADKRLAAVRRAIREVERDAAAAARQAIREAGRRR